MKNLLISPAPHIHSGDSIEKNMYKVLIALIPAFITSIIFMGVGAIAVTMVSVLACVCVEFVIQKYLLKQISTIFDGSAILTGILLGFNLPSNIPIWIVIIGALVAIGVGKMSFGGLGGNIFNPALVGRVFLLISFPVQMTTWPIVNGLDATSIDATTGATPLGLLKQAVNGGVNISDFVLSSDFVGYKNMFLGNIGGSLGEISALALLLGFVYLLITKVITWHIPVAIFVSAFIFAESLHLANPEHYIGGLYHLLSGGMMLGAIYMATDYVTSPMTKKGMLIYGVGIGILTIIIRVFGVYPEGMSFAILIMNACTPLINRYVKPKRFA